MSDLFEKLREKANKNFEDDPGYHFAHQAQALGWKQGINATIEALREMIVGEPIEGYICHHQPMRTTCVAIMGEGLDNRFTISSRDIGTDGEEVTVVVLRRHGGEDERAVS